MAAKPRIVSTPPTPASPIRVALYTRVSTDMQASKDEGSLDTQEARLRSSLASRTGRYDVEHVFREEGESGKSLDRPALQDLMARVRAGDVDLVMVTRLDRLSRSLLDFYELHRLFEEHGVEFVSLNETFDTSTAVGRAMLKLVLVFAELEREQTAERTRTALKARAERGLWNGGHPPLGYDSAGGGHIVINPVEADLVRMIFAKYEETRSSVIVYKWLNDSGHRQKVFSSRRRGASGGKPFTIACVQTVLKNRLYLGDIDFKGEIYQGQHEAIVARDTFERVQAIVANNDKGVRGPPLRTTYDYLLTGVLRCACGHALTTSAGNGKGGRYHYYRCVGLIKKPGQHVCAVKQVRAEHTDDLVMSLVRDAARDPKLVAEAVDQVNQMSRDLIDPMRTRVDQARAELQRAENDAARVLTQILSAGIATSPTARRLLADTEARQAQLRAALSRAEGELATRESQFLDLEVTVDALRGFDVAFDHLTSAEKRELLHLLLKQVEVHPDHIVVELYEGRRAIHYLVTNPTLAAVTEPDLDPDSGKHDHGPQNDETPGSRPGFVSVPKWLPERDGGENLEGSMPRGGPREG